MSINWFGILLGTIALVCVLLPPSRDPAIRFKERLEREEDEDVEQDQKPPAP